MRRISGLCLYFHLSVILVEHWKILNEPGRQALISFSRLLTIYSKLRIS